MEIYAKSKFNNNIYDKMQKGATAIEIHLDDDFVEVQECWNEKIVSEVPIVAVHAPLIQKNDTNIEQFSNRQIIVKTCNFARRIAETQKHSVTVVCHIGTDTEVLKSLGIYNDLVFFMRDLANVYENLAFVIENVTPFANDADHHLAFRSIEHDTPVKFVKDVAHPRVGTCLDTCHAMMLTRFLTNTANYLKHDAELFDNPALRDGIEAFFSAYKDTIAWIHLSNSKCHGLYEDHGLPFTKDDDDMLRYIMNLYHKYDYKCPITLEVREDDYADAVNYATTYESLSRILQDLETADTNKQ